MYIVTDKAGVILHLSQTIGYQDNGNVLVDNGSTAIAAALVGGVSEDMDVPVGVAAGSHCYADGAFAPNPAYMPPEPSQEERLSALESIVDDLLVATLEQGVMG